MPKYMTQPVSSGVLKKITYYRKQTSDHVSHSESSTFTTDAKNAYAAKNGIDAAKVELGTYKSGQGVPTGGTVEQI